jgi:hypothetical protein
MPFTVPIAKQKNPARATSDVLKNGLSVLPENKYTLPVDGKK